MTKVEIASPHLLPETRKAGGNKGMQPGDGGACLQSQYLVGRGREFSEYEVSQSYTEKPCLEKKKP